MKFDIGIEVDDSIKALLFDLDGTLVDNMHLHIQAWVQAGEDFSIPITAEMITINAGIPTKQLIKKLSEENNWSIDEEAFKTTKQRLYKEIKKADGKINKIDSIIAIAEYYHGKIPMTIGTGSSRGNALAALEDAEILDWFDLVVTADDVEFPKPHPEVYLKGAKFVGVDPKDCLVFEDGDKGIQSAIDAGMKWVDVRDYLQ